MNIEEEEKETYMASQKRRIEGNKAPEFFTLDEWFDKFKSD